MRVPVYNEKGAKTESTVELPKEIFGIKPNLAALRQSIHTYQINQRQGTAATKTRGAVSGGGRKPWVQKGTGRARHGSIRSPIWVGGGTTFGPQPRDFSASLPRKVRNLALCSALSEKAAAGRVFVVRAFAPKEPRTSLAMQLLRKLKASSPLVVAPNSDARIVRSFRNIPGVAFSTVANLNPYAVVRSHSILLLGESINLLKHRLGVKAAEVPTAKGKKAAPVGKRLPVKRRAVKVKPRGKKR